MELNMNKLYAICFTLCLLFGLTVFAETVQTTPGIRTSVTKARQKRQATRIRRGVVSGALTKGEAASIMKDEKAIRQEKRAARADGTVTGAERRELRQDQNQASRQIYQKKHNNRTRR
jgi:hypothetical protein